MKLQLEKQIQTLQNSQLTAQGMTKLNQAMAKMKDSQIQKLKDEIGELKSQLTNALQNQEQLTMSNKGVESIEDLRAKLQSLSYINHQAELNIAQLQSNYKDLETRLSQEQSLSLNLQADNSSLQKTIKDMEDKISSIEATSHEQVMTIRKQREELVEERRQLEADQALVIENLRNQFENDKQALQNQMQIKDQENKLRVNQLQEMVRRLEREIEESSKSQKDDTLKNQLEKHLEMIKQSTLEHKSKQDHFISLNFKLKDITQQNIALVNQVKQLQDQSQNMILMEDKLKECMHAYQYLTMQYQQLYKESIKLQNDNDSQELLIKVLESQFKEIKSKLPQMQVSEDQSKLIFSQIVARTSIVVKEQGLKYIDDKHQLLNRLTSIESENKKEKDLLIKLTKDLKRLSLKSNLTQNIDSIFMHLDDQIQALRELRQAQKDNYEEIKEIIKEKGQQSELKEDSILESQKGQIQGLEAQKQILEKQLQILQKDKDHYKSENDQLKLENTSTTQRIYQLTKDQIKFFSDINSHLTEIGLLKNQTNTLLKQLQTAQEDNMNQQNEINTLTKYIKDISIVQATYASVNVDKNMQKILNEQVLANNQLKSLGEQQRIRIAELEGIIQIVKEDYAIMKQQTIKMQEKENNKQSEDQQMKDDHAQSEDKQCQTIPSMDQDLLSFILSDYDLIHDHLSQSLSDLDQLLDLFKQNTTLSNTNEVDVFLQYRQQEEEVAGLRERNTKMKEQLEKQDKYIKAKTAQWSQAQPQQQVRTVIQQDPQQIQKLSSKIDDLTSQNSSLTLQIKRQEDQISQQSYQTSLSQKSLLLQIADFKKELEGMKEGGQQQQAQSVIFSKLMTVMKKAQKVMISIEAMCDNQQ